MAILVIPHSDHRAIAFQPYGVIPSCTDRHDVCPAADITFAIIIRSFGDHSTVTFQSYGVIVSCADGHDVCPAVEALYIIFISHSDHCAVGFHSNGVVISCTDCHNVRPAADITFATLIISHSDHRAVCFQSYGVVGSCADRHDVCPAADITLAILVIPRSDHRAIAFQPYGVIPSCADSIPNRDDIPQDLTAFGRIPIIAQFSEGNRCFRCLSIFLKLSVRMRFCIFCVFITIRCRKCRNRTVIIPGRKQLFRLGIVCSWYNNLCGNQNHCGNDTGGNCDFFLPRRCRKLVPFLLLFSSLFPLHTQALEFFCISLIFRSLCKRFFMLCSQLCFRSLQKSLISVDHTLLFGLRLLRCRLLLLAQGVRKRAVQRLTLRFCLAGSEFLCACEISVVIQPLHGLFLRVAEICRPVGAIAPVKTQRCTDIRRVVILWHLIVLYARINKRLILCARLGIALRRRISGDPCTDALHIGLHVRPARLGQELPQICRAAFCVLIEHLLEKLISLAPLAVFQRHLSAVEQRLYVAAALVMYHDGLFDRLCHSLLRLCRVHDLFDAPDEVLNKTDFAHILTLQHTEFFWHIIRVHIAVAGDEQTAAVGAHERKVAAPLVFHPDGVKMLRLRADYDHDLRRVQGSKDIRLIFLPELILQRDARKEDLIARVGELVVNILRQRGILRTLAVLVRLFITDEHVKRRFLLRDRQNVLLQRGNALRFFFVQAPCHTVGVFARSLIVHVVQNAVKARAVTGRDALAGGRILHILDAVPAEQQVPVRLSIRVVLPDQSLVDRRSFVKLTVSPQMRATVE